MIIISTLFFSLLYIYFSYEYLFIFWIFVSSFFQFRRNIFIENNKYDLFFVVLVLFYVNST